MDGTEPLILLPGMGADSRMFEPLCEALPQLVTPNWIAPLGNESLNAYARRLADAIDPGVPCHLGGASFGGVVALEVAAVLKARTCFLIGSIKSPAHLPMRVKLLRPLTPFIGLLPSFAWLFPPLAGAAFGPRARRIAQQLTDADARFLRWASRAILTWTPSPEVVSVRVRHLHGDRDRIFPVELAHPDVIVKGAGHVLSVTHPDQTAKFLREGMMLSMSWR